MRLAVTQPNFFPWLGYFDLLDSIDKIIFLDNVALSTRSFMVRNRMKNKQDKPFWMSEAIRHKSQNKLICEHFVVEDRKWLLDIMNMIDVHYREAACYGDLQNLLNRMLSIESSQLPQFNASIILLISDYLGITFDYDFASRIETSLVDSPQDRILDICVKQDTREYYAFKNGIEEGLYSGDVFSAKGIRLMKQMYNHPEYKQVGSSFLSHLSILDLIANAGRDAADIIRKGRQWQTVN